MISLSNRDQNSQVKLHKQRAYWHEKLLAPLPILEIPQNPSRSRSAEDGAGKKSNKNLIESPEFPTELYHKLRKFSQKQNCSFFIPLLAATQAVFLRYTGQEDIILGSIGISHFTNSEPVDTSRLINGIALRTNVSSNLTVKELLANITQTVEEAANNRDYPLEKLTEELDETSFFQVMLIPCQMPFELADTPIESENLAQITELSSNCDLNIFVVPTEQSLILKCEYNSGLFESASIQRLLRHLQTLLAGLIGSQEQDIASLPLLTEAEEQQLIEWNDTRQDYPLVNCIHNLFELQAAKTPSSIAVVFEEDELTYQQLNQKANQVAHYLRSRGVKAETLVQHGGNEPSIKRLKLCPYMST